MVRATNGLQVCLRNESVTIVVRILQQDAKKRLLYFVTQLLSLGWRINYISEHLQSNYFSYYNLNKKQTSVEIVLKL